MICHSDEISTLDQVIQKCWTLEEIPGESNKILTPEQQSCESHFVENTKLLPIGRFQVMFPFKETPSSLGSSYDNAKRRFLSLERKLWKNDDLKAMYMDFMNEYLTL